MNVRKLPSGSYQVRKQYKGKQYSFTLDHKPTQKEVIQLLSNALDEDPISSDSFEGYAERFFATRGKSLSPTTLPAYKSLLKNMGDFKYKNLRDITNEDIQKEINEHAKTHAAKTTSNLKGFISSVFSAYRPNFKINARTPQVPVYMVYVPTDEEVKKILDAAKGTPYEVALWLSVYGLRRGEICAIKPEDLSEDNLLTINKSYTNHGGGITKVPKTGASTRTIYIAPFLADMIRKQGYVYNGHIHSILKALHRFQDELGIERFRLHDMRHYFTSVAFENDLKEADVMRLGGWSTPHVMKTRYRHSRIDQDIDKKKDIAQKLAQNLE